AKATSPVRSINLDNFNFRRLSSLRSRDGAFHLTFSFFDEDHLLLTFEGSDMVRRHRTCPRTHEDRIVHAVVVNPKTGEVQQRADWYLHDRQPYLWPLASGKMLLRKGDDLFQLDQRLTETAALEHSDIFWADSTPDGTQIVAGVAVPKAATQKHTENRKSDPPKYEMRFLDANSLSVLGTVPQERPIPQRLTDTGIADVI